MFDIVLLRTFLAVADAGHFTKGGAALGLSQSTVSQHIRRLETVCGRELIARDTHGVTLTPDGAVMVGFAREIVESSQRASAYFSDAAPRGRVRFGVSEDLALTRLPLILRDLIRTSPLLNVELTIGLTGMLYKKLDAGRLDLVFAKRQPGDERGIVVKRERLIWVAHPNFDLDPAAAIPLVSYPTASITSELAVSALCGCGRSWFLACSSETLSGISAAVQAGLGVTAQSSLLLQISHGALAPAAAALPARGAGGVVVLGRSVRRHGAVAALAALIADHGPSLWDI